MKKITLFLSLLLLTIFKSEAQQTFAPIGAEWHYEGELGMYNYWGSQSVQNYNWNDHVKSIGDSSISGQACRILEITRSTKTASSSTISVGAPSYQYVYDQNDTTYYFNKDSVKFLPLYIWNVSPGDTVHLPHLNTRGFDFFFVVDSIISVLYDTSHLKTYYVTSFMDTVYTTGEIQNWGGTRNTGMVSHGRYVEKLGGIASLLPSFVNTNPDGISEILNPAGRLICYTDTSTSMKLVPNIACDTIFDAIYTGINNVAKSMLQLNIAPNPASTQINIQSQVAFESNSQLIATDMLGRTMMTPLQLDKKKNASIDVSHWANGIYLLKFELGAQAYYQKISVQH